MDRFKELQEERQALGEKIKTLGEDAENWTAEQRQSWTDLNEEDDQQGAEGKEDYRAIFTFSVLL